MSKEPMAPLLIDTHSHLDMLNRVNVSEVIADAKRSGVTKIVIPAVDKNSFKKIIDIANNYDEVYCALGIHPSEAANASENNLNEIVELYKKENKVIAIGECGLDYYWGKDSVDIQKVFFKRQIEIANELNATLIVHDRDAHKDTYDLLAEAKVPVVMHCFSGSLEFAKECIKKGYYIALGGVVTFKNAKKAHEVAKHIPLEYLLLETDAPFLTPEPYRGKENEPAYVKFVAERIAQMREIPYEEVATATTENARKAFGI